MLEGVANGYIRIPIFVDIVLSAELQEIAVEGSVEGVRAFLILLVPAPMLPKDLKV